MQILSLLMAAVQLTGLSSLAAASETSGANTPQFHNSARHAGADPYVLYDSNSGQYFAYSTEGADEGYNFAIYSSPDLATWHKHPGGVLKACKESEENSSGHSDASENENGGQACWARDWFWAPETYYNEKTGWYFFFFAGRLREDLTKDYFCYSKFEEPSKIGVAVSRSPTGPFREIESRPIDYYPFDPDYHDVNLIMDEAQMLPPQSLEEGKTAPKGTYIPTIDVNIFFDSDDRIYLYLSRNSYRNWNWDAKLGKYIEESNIIVVEMESDWWNDPTASTMPEILSSQKDMHAKDAPELPSNITSYNGTGEIGHVPRKDGWKTVISYGADPQEWENYHFNDFKTYNGTRKDRRWSEGSTLITRPDSKTSKPVYLMTYSANNYEASNYGVGFATSDSPMGPFYKSTSNPVLSQLPEDVHGIPIYSTGHGSIVASPPRSAKDKPIRPQEVTIKTPRGSELFYVHHARDDTALNRSMYTTRMTLDESAIHVGSQTAIRMHLTPLDQPLPKNTYPIQMQVDCFGYGHRSDSGAVGRKFDVRVISKTDAPFDLSEGSNRVVAFPGPRSPTSVRSSRRDGSFSMNFGGGAVKELAYQRLSVDGTWSTVARTRVP